MFLIYWNSKLLSLLYKSKVDIRLKSFYFLFRSSVISGIYTCKPLKDITWSLLCLDKVLDTFLESFLDSILKILILSIKEL